MGNVDFRDYRIDDIQYNIDMMGITPLDVMVTGATGTGKSTTLNTLFKKKVAKVGRGVDPETMNIESYGLNDYFRLWDTPGLGDGVVKDSKHKKKIMELLYKTYSANNRKYGLIDLVLVIIEGSSRDLGTVYSLLNEVIVPNIQKDRILVAINQADISMKGRHWESDLCVPDEVLAVHLNEQALSIQHRVKEATGVKIIKPVCYSAEYNWNIEKVMDLIIDNMPRERRKIE